MPWFVKLEEGIVDKTRFDAAVPAHLTWLRQLNAEGHRPMSGYWADRVGCNGEGAGGMLIFQAASLAEAERLVRHDPLIQQGCVRWVLHEWQPVFTGTGAVAPGEGAAFRNETEAPARNSADGTPAPPG
ncbi:MAG: YciI family protein [Cyanobacteriota bacterium]|nr:YciI family protein [Cyanobacteriota bacterium]